MKRILLLGILLIWSSGALSQESLPPYHWSWQYLDYLKSAGYLPGLDITHRPVQRSAVAGALSEVTSPDPIIQGMLRILQTEFRPEIWQWEAGKDLLQQVGEKILEPLPKPQVKAGIFSLFNWQKDRPDYQKELGYDFHPLLSVKWNRNFSALLNGRFFNRKNERYVGKEFRNLYSYVEQGYLQYQNRWLQVKFGRDFMQLGPGRSGQLLLSDNSRPFDLYLVRLKSKYLSFSFWGIQLNRRSVTDSTLQQFATTANRYLNGHRLAFNYRDRYLIAFTEQVLYGGPASTWELGYLNPIGNYYGYNANGPYTAANLFYTLDWDLYFPHRVNFYGELLIDDLQIDNETPGDLEPNEIGLLMGFNWGNPFRWTGSLFNAEYVQVRNRTYNAPVYDWEKYLHRNEVIGYYLGNDFKLAHFNLEKWWLPVLKTRLISRIIRKGEGTVQGEFNTDYLNYTVEEGYHEPFPWGIVEKHLQLGLEVFFRPHRLANVSASLAWNRFDNYQHVEGQSKTEVSFYLSIWVQWDKWWTIK